MNNNDNLIDDSGVHSGLNPVIARVAIFFFNAYSLILAALGILALIAGHSK